MNIPVTYPLLAGHHPTPCSNTTVKKLHGFLTTRPCAGQGSNKVVRGPYWSISSCG
jgi:hypothetical protein